MCLTTVVRLVNTNIEQEDFVIFHIVIQVMPLVNDDFFLPPQ